MPEIVIWISSGLALILGGVIKGALGVGLPLVSVPVLALWLPTGRAIGVLSVPVILSNLVQAKEGSDLGSAWTRFKGLIITQLIATVLAVRMTADMSPQHLNMLVSIAVFAAVALMWLQPAFEIRNDDERRTSIFVGAVAGTLGGVSSLTGPVLITYLMALQLKRDEFVRSISLIYLTGSLPIYGGMLFFGRITWVDVGLSVIALFPVYIGMRAGRAIRHQLDDILFRRIVLGFLLGVAVLLFAKSW